MTHKRPFSCWLLTLLYTLELQHRFVWNKKNCRKNEKITVEPSDGEKKLPNGKHQMKMFSCRIGRRSSGWKRRLEKRSVMKVMSFGKQMVDLFFFSHIVLCSNTVDIRPRSTDTNFPKRMNKHHWQIEEEVYFSLLIFLLSLSLHAVLLELPLYFCFDMFTWLILAKSMRVCVFIKVFSSSPGLFVHRFFFFYWLTVRSRSESMCLRTVRYKVCFDSNSPESFGCIHLMGFRVKITCNTDSWDEMNESYASDSKIQMMWCLMTLIRTVMKICIHKARSLLARW